jgi:hypothetical protein
MLEIEFVDRSIALAGKAFVSFFPLVIVVALRTRTHPFVDPHQRHGPTRPSGRRARARQGSLRVVG